MALAESPMSFLESLPGYARAWCWLPHQTITLTLALPHGPGTVFHAWWCPAQAMMAHNVAQITAGGLNQ